MKKFRLLALDIDGTLLDDNKEIPAANRQALAKAVEQGVQVAIASGRMTPRIDAVAEELGIDPIIIAYNGGKVLAPRREERRMLVHEPLPAPVAERFIQFSQKEGLLLNFYHEDRLYAEDGAQRRPLMEIYSRRTGAEYVIESDLARFMGITPTKLILLAEPARRDLLYEEFKEELGERAFLAKSEPEYLEIMAPKVNKGSSITGPMCSFSRSTMGPSPSNMVASAAEISEGRV